MTAGKLVTATRNRGRAVAAAARRTRRAAHRAPRRTVALLAASTLVLLLAAAGFGLLAAQRTRAEAARADALAAAQRSVGELLSYDYRSLEHDLAERQALLTGKFRADYADLVGSVVAPAAARTQLLTRANIAQAAVMDNAGDEEVTVLLLVNQTTRSSASPEPQLVNSRIKVTVRAESGRWLVSELQPL